MAVSYLTHAAQATRPAANLTMPVLATADLNEVVKSLPLDIQYPSDRSPVGSPDTTMLQAAILAELERQAEESKANGLYLYSTDDKETGIDGMLDLTALTKAVVAC
jgi:hypothetical protein